MKTFIKIILAIGGGLLGALAGMLAGALIGGNFFEGFMFNQLRGYEATGQLGAIIGAILGAIFTWLFLDSKSH